MGVTHHRVLWSPDFPLPGPPINSPKRIDRLSGQRPSGRPADQHLLYSAGPVQFTRSQYVAAFPRMRVARILANAATPTLGSDNGPRTNHGDREIRLERTATG